MIISEKIIKRLAAVLAAVYCIFTVCAMSCGAVEQNIRQESSEDAVEFTAEEQELIRSGREIVVGFYKATEPLAYVDRDGSFCGVYPELMTDVRQLSGLNIILKPLDRDKSWKELINDGSIDFYIGASAGITDLDPDTLSTDTFLEYVTVLITNKDTNFMNIKDPTIALTNGRTYWVDYLPESLGNVKIDFYESAKDCLSAVHSGRADATLINNYEFNYYTKNSRFASLMTWENFRFVGEGGLTAAADVDPVLFSAVNKALGRLTPERVNEVVSNNLNMAYRGTFADSVYAARNAIAGSVLLTLMVSSVVIAISVLRRRQRAALDKVRENEREQLRILAALSLDYDVVFYSDLTSDLCRVVRLNEEKTTLSSESTRHSEGMKHYINARVKPEYRDKLMRFADPAEILNVFDTSGDFSVRYKINPDANGREYFEMHFVDAGENDGKRMMVFGIRCVDAAAKEEKASQQLLQDALEAANRANSAKSDFLSKMSHDMRTPLNGIIGMTAIAGNYLDEPDRVKDSLGKISASGKYLLALINEVLDMSKIESGTISLNEDEFDLSTMLDELMTMIHPQLVRHKHKMSFNIKELRHNEVIGDSLRLQQVFLNILGNSVKYTNDGGELSLTVTEKHADTPKSACFEFVFRDNGIGMTEEYLEHIFEPFTRAEDLRISKIQGTGLGMSIAQNIVRMMNGSIEVESELGKGSVFTVTVFLRVRESKGEEYVEEPKSGVLSSNESHSELYDISSSDYSGSRVLLVEDNLLNLEIATEILKMAGLEVDEAENGRIAVEKFSASGESYYDMVFMDLQMPEMNGYEAARAIRALDRKDAAEVPIVAMTANAFAEDIKATREAGMNEHLAKPIDFVKLNEVMKKYLRAVEET